MAATNRGHAVPVTAKGEATRAFLLRTAARVFAEQGYGSASMADLIAASGLTKGAFYFYFRSKSDLAVAVLHDQHDRWRRRVGEQVLAAGSPADQLRALVPAMLDLLADTPEAWSITRLTRELAADAALVDDVGRPMADWIDLVADVVRRGQSAGELRPGPDPHAVAVVLVGAFDGLKALTDVLDPGAASSGAFAARAATLLDLVERALVVGTDA